MNFEITAEQEMVRDTFARFLDDHSTTAQVRAAQTDANGPSGFDPALWQGLAELGAFAMRVPEAAGGMGMGLFEAVLLMEEAGRTLVSGPLAEALVGARLLGLLGGDETLLEQAIAGTAMVGFARHDIAQRPVQWVAGGLVAQAVIARSGNDIVLITVPEYASRRRKTSPPRRSPKSTWARLTGRCWPVAIRRSRPSPPASRNGSC